MSEQRNGEPLTQMPPPMDDFTIQSGSRSSLFGVNGDADADDATGVRSSYASLQAMKQDRTHRTILKQWDPEDSFLYESDEDEPDAINAPLLGASRSASRTSLRRSKSRKAGFFKHYFCSQETVLPAPQEYVLGQLYIVLVCLFVIYNASVIPFRLAFRDVWSNNDLSIAFNTMDYLGDFVFIVDIILNFRFAVVSDGIEVREMSIIIATYMSSYFWLDVIASVPLDIFVWNYYWIHVLLRLPKLLRLRRVLERINTVQHNSHHGHIIELLKLIVGILVICHWMGCLYFCIAYLDGFTPDGEEGWAPPESLKSAAIGQQYFIAFAWGVKAVTDVGGETPRAETNLQHWFVICLGFIHIFIIAVVVGSVEQFMAHLNHADEQLRLRMTHLNHFMTQRKLPRPLQDRIRQYYFHLWTRKGAFDNPELLREMPSNLRAEVQAHTRGQVLSKIPLFEGADQKFLDALVDRLNPRIYAPNDIVVQEGEPGDEMFFLNRGTVEILDADGNVLAVLAEGSIIGEVAFFQPEHRRCATVRARTWCDFASLERIDFDRVCVRFPEQRRAMESLAFARMSYAALSKSLARHSVMTDVPKHVLQSLQKKFEPYEFEPGEIIYEEGQLGDVWLFCGHGSVEVSMPRPNKPIPSTEKRPLKTPDAASADGNGKADADAKSSIPAQETTNDVRVVEEEFFGELLFLTDPVDQRIGMATAATRCTILAISARDFLETISRYNVKDIVERNMLAKSRRESARVRFKSAIQKVLKAHCVSGGFLQFNASKRLSTAKQATANHEMLSDFGDMTQKDRIVAERVWMSERDLQTMDMRDLNRLQFFMSRMMAKVANVQRDLQATLIDERDRAEAALLDRSLLE